jgi:hypothetical protein
MWLTVVVRTLCVVDAKGGPMSLTRDSSVGLIWRDLETVRRDLEVIYTIRLARHLTPEESARYNMLLASESRLLSVLRR